jgi:hypothetical protein
MNHSHPVSIESAVATSPGPSPPNHALTMIAPKNSRNGVPANRPPTRISAAASSQLATATP